MQTTDQIAETDANIATAEAAVARLASERKAAQRMLAEYQIDGKERAAREQRAKVRELAEDIDFEESRLVALKNHRAALTDADEAAKQAACWAEAERINARRKDAAVAAENAFADAAKAIADLEASSRELDQITTRLPVRLNRLADDVRPGVAYTLIANGFGWLIPDSRETCTTGRRLIDRVVAAETYLHQAKEDERKAA